MISSTIGSGGFCVMRGRINAVAKPLKSMKHITNIVFILIYAISSAQDVVSYKLSECDSDSYVELVRRRIVSKTVNEDTLSLKLGFVENCCLNPKPTINKSNDTLFLSMENVSELFCGCACSFEIEVKVSSVSDTNFVLMWGKYAVKTQSKYPKLPHEYQFDENTPVNELNKDSLKIGLWYEYRESTGHKHEIYYDLNPSEKSVDLWTRVYDSTGELIQIAIRRGSSGNLIQIEPNEYSRIFEK